jgi:hypothetical protein
MRCGRQVGRNLCARNQESLLCLNRSSPDSALSSQARDGRYLTRTGFVPRPDDWPLPYAITIQVQLITIFYILKDLEHTGWN